MVTILGVIYQGPDAPVTPLAGARMPTDAIRIVRFADVTTADITEPLRTDGYDFIFVRSDGVDTMPGTPEEIVVRSSCLQGGDEGDIAPNDAHHVRASVSATGVYTPGYADMLPQSIRLHHDGSGVFDIIVELRRKRVHTGL